uniref:Uncharacterized protein n=1 Tax=Glossina austeni TaxID=7395 RepID=A0A1A9VTE5_GLOAU
MLKNPENFIIVTTGISLWLIFVNVETKRYINITANAQTDFQPNPNEIWTFRSSSLKRSKRTFLAYGMGGVVKLVLGVSLPITLASPKRSLRVFYNLQLQYVPPPDPIYWWSVLNSTTFESRTQHSKQLLYDNSRSLIYKYLENIFRSIDALNNQECLQRFICDLSRTPLNVDLSESVHYILHKIVNAIFTPIQPNVEPRYWEAQEAGRHGAHCRKTFSRCSLSEDVLNQFMRFI